MGDALGFGEAATGRAEDAGGMGFIDQQPGVMGVFGGDDIGEGCLIAVHGEDTFGDHQDAGWGTGGGGGEVTGPAEEAGEVVHLVMAEHAEACAAEAGGIDEAGMGEAVEDDHIVGAEEGGEGSEGGGVAGGEGEGGGGLFEVGEGGFQMVVRGEGAGDQAGGGGTGAELEDGLLGGEEEAGVMGEAEVIIGCEIEEVAAVDGDAGGGGGIEGAQGAAEGLGIEGKKDGLEGGLEGHGAPLTIERSHDGVKEGESWWSRELRH